ncbi:MAG: 50S ribosomal protein L11 methyltransferase [Pseudomonadota bacterium]|nr:50S ribosomal protein L11 methyltransferase [Pseudomonadota bacterium]
MSSGDIRRMRGRKSAPAAAAASPSMVARLDTDQATARRLADIIAEILDPEGVAVAAYETPKGWVLNVHFASAADPDALRRLVAREAGTRAAKKLVFQKLAAADWVKASLQGLQPVEAGRFVIHGAHARARIPVNRIAIEIEAALAFGTGHHGTTHGCLLALDALIKRRKSKPVIPGRPERPDRESRAGFRARAGACHRVGPSGPDPLGTPRNDARANILDIGTGSGVLAIAAARALRSRVLASDIDATALRIARGNIRRNRCGALIETLAAAGIAARRFRQRAPYDLVFANILLGPLQRMAAPIARLLAPGGVAILSGLLPKQANAVIAACRAQSLSLERRIVLDNWVTLVMRRR